MVYLYHHFTFVPFVAGKKLLIDIQYNKDTSIALKSSGNLSSAAHQNNRFRQFLVGSTIPVMNRWIDMLRSCGVSEINRLVFR